MKRVLTAVILIPLVLLILFKAPAWLYSGFIGVIAFLAAREYFGIAEKYHQPLHRYVILGAVTAYFLGHCLGGVTLWGIPEFGSTFEDWTFLLTGYRVLPLLLLVLGLFFRELREVIVSAAISYLGFLYIGVTLGEISLTGHYPNGRVMVFVFLIIVWSGDIFAYYVGRTFGKHKLAETISPKKTWEGAIASTLGAVLVSLLLFRYLHEIGNVLTRLDVLPSRSVLYSDAHICAPSSWLAAVFGLCVNLAAQAGDLVESALKRGAEVKDSGTLLPGHGGILDRIDAMLLAAPVLWFFHGLLYKAISVKP